MQLPEGTCHGLERHAYLAMVCALHVHALLGRQGAIGLRSQRLLEPAPSLVLSPLCTSWWYGTAFCSAAFHQPVRLLIEMS